MSETERFAHSRSLDSGSSDTTGFLGIELNGGPENQDEKIDLGVHWVEMLTLSLKVLDMECQIRENTSKLLSKRFKTFSLPVHLLINLGSLFQPRGVVVCILACRSQFTKIIVSDGFSLKVKTLGIGLL